MRVKSTEKLNSLRGDVKMELTMVGLGFLYPPRAERRSRKEGIDLARIHQAAQARRAREHREFLTRQGNLTNCVLNIPIL
jgi:hypothetical protein